MVGHLVENMNIYDHYTAMRSKTKNVYTPQVFKYELLKEAYWILKTFLDTYQNKM